MSNFASAVKAQLEAQQDLRPMEQHALTIVSNPDTPRHARIIERWEHKSRKSLKLDPSSIIDWFKANWKTILQVVLSILGLVLMFAETDPGDTVMMGAEGEMAWFPAKNIIQHFLPEILDQLVMPPLGLAIQDVQNRMSGLPVSLGYSAEQMKTWILAKVDESQNN